MEIRQKTALITGAAKRVGRSIALSLAGQGANILLHYNTSKAEAEETAAQIRNLKVECRLLQADLAQPEQALRLGREAGRVDILVNSASLFYKTPLEGSTEKDWDALMNTNLKGPFLLSKEIGVRMASGAGGKIINIADWSGFRPYKDYAPYCSSKGGLLTLTKALARDLAPKVSVNAVAPGPVMLPADFPEEEKQLVIKKTLLGRVGSPEDVANAVIFLVDSDFINGFVLVVDGGRSIV